jgi:2-methylisocitrate lyase-like PEP mutase family enzyme
MSNTQAARLRALIAGGGLFVAPGVFDGLSARLVERAGFVLAYASGGAIARSAGLPDLGLLSASEIAARMASIAEAVSLPVIGDADTGYGNALNAARAMRDFVRAGLAGVHLEDQTFPKRCGHLDDKAVIPAEEMVGKLRAAKDAAGDDLVIIARTDALAVEGLGRAIERAHRYMEAGAEVVFVEAPVFEAQIAEIARALPYPKLINMFHGGKTPVLPLETLRRLDYRIVIVPSDLQRAAIAAMTRTLAALAAEGNSLALADEMASFAEREAIVGTDAWLALGKRYATARGAGSSSGA